VRIFTAHIRSAVTLFLLIAFALVTTTPAASQTAVTKVLVTHVSANDSFPDVLVQAQALDASGVFIPNLIADAFDITEDGEVLPIREVTSGSLPVSLKMVFVIDEFSITSRLGTVREAIRSFTENQMRTGDRVAVLAADAQGRTQTIVPFTSDPAQVADALLEANYNPPSASYTRLLKTIQRAMTDLSSSGDISGVNTIVVFSVSMVEQTDIYETIEQARLLDIPVHTVLLSEQDVLGALNRLARETRTGNGAIFPDDLNGLFDRLNAQRNRAQYLISYRSQATQAGDHELVLKIDDVASAVIPFTIDQLEPAEVRITTPGAGTTITRIETELDQESQTVQPTEQTVTVEVRWPDGHPRQIVSEKTALVVNGESLGAATTIRDNGRDPVILEFAWDLQEQRTPGTTSVSVSVEVEDELGLKSASEPLPARIDYVLFATCPNLISQNIPQLCSNWNLIVPLASLVVAIAALIHVRRTPKTQAQLKKGLRRTVGTIIPGRQATMIVEPLGSAKASLLVLEGHSGTSQMEFGIHGTTTIGRSTDFAQLVLQSNRENSPISRLHCTLLERDGRFEIRDEATPNGTYVNGVRLVKAELRPLKDGDTVEIAQASHGGVKFKFQLILRPGYTRTLIVSPNGTETSDDRPTKVINK
jgi:hypothetical protein